MQSLDRDISFTDDDIAEVRHTVVQTVRKGGLITPPLGSLWFSDQSWRFVQRWVVGLDERPVREFPFEQVGEKLSPPIRKRLEVVLPFICRPGHECVFLDDIVDEPIVEPPGGCATLVQEVQERCSNLDGALAAMGFPQSIVVVPSSDLTQVLFTSLPLSRDYVKRVVSISESGLEL